VADAEANGRAPRRIALLGVRGAGKTTIGAKLAAGLGVEFFELDRLVEAEAGMALGEIFATHGEGYFRRLEVAALRRLLAEREASCSRRAAASSRTPKLGAAGRARNDRVAPCEHARALEPRRPPGRSSPDGGASGGEGRSFAACSRAARRSIVERATASTPRGSVSTVASSF